MSFKFNGHIIKAITIKQSFSTLIVNGVIDTENELLSKKIYVKIGYLFIQFLKTITHMLLTALEKNIKQFFCI